MEEKKQLTPGKRKFMTAVTVICIVLSLCSLAILAWFGINTQVEDDGMGIMAKVSPLLVISDDKEALKTIDPSEGNAFVVADTEALNHEFVPCTRTDEGDKVLSDVDLKYLDNTGDVSLKSGLMKKDKTASFMPVDPDRYKDDFYIESTVYIASVDKVFENRTLSARITHLSRDMTEDLNSYLGAAVDFYRGEVYIGTLHCYEAEEAMVDGVAVEESVPIVLYTGDIPLNTDEPIEVTMRCYFDGAALDPSGTAAYINSRTVSAENVGFTVEFDLDD